jgi:F-type H+-transporting ATPase subunit b
VKRYSLARLSLALFLMLACAAFAGAQENAQAKEKTEPGIAWKWANFAILAVGLGYLINKHLPPFFRSRTAEIQQGITEAQHIKRDAEARAAQVEARMQKLGEEIDRFRAQSREEMQQEGERIRQETAKQLGHLEQLAQQEIEAAGKVARRELKDYAAKLALDLAGQRVRARLNAGTETALVDGFIQDLQRQESHGTESQGKESRN